MRRNNDHYDDYDEYNDYGTYENDELDTSYDLYNDMDLYQYDKAVEYSEYDDNYEEEYENKNNELRSKILLNRNKILIAIIIIMIIFLIIWLTPQFLNRSKSKNTDTTLTKSRNIDNDLKEMKNAALKYYKKENIPKQTGENKKITLQKLTQQDFIKKLDDFYNNKKSYSNLIKEDNKFVLEIKLTTEKESKTKKYYVNNYTYCISTYLCEEQLEENTESIKEIDENEEVDIEETITEENKESYLYEYSKTTKGKLSKWSLWNSYEKTSCSTKSITCNDNDFNCLQEIKLYNRKENVGTTSKKYVSTRNSYTYHTLENTKGCNSYDYMKINGSYYKSPTENQFTSIGTFTSSNPTNHGSWIYLGRNTYSTPPSDSLKTRYVFVTSEKSCTNCQSTPNYTYDVYNFQGTLKKISNPATDCNNKSVQKTVPIYTIAAQTITVNRTETLYGTVCYQSSRNRTILEKGTTKTTWSNYDDQVLLNDGYTYTGNKKEK